MKVIDLQIYRSKKAISDLEKKIGELALIPQINAARKIKIFFREWLAKTGTLN